MTNPVTPCSEAVMVLAVTMALIQSTSSLQNVWHQFVPADSAFSVTLPAVPKTTIMYTQTRHGPLPTNLVSVDDSDSASYLVSWTEYANANARRGPADSLVTRMVDALARTKGAVTVSNPLGATDPSGAPAVLRSADGRTIQVRFFFAGNRIYQIMAETRGDAQSLERANRFLSSFGLLRR